MTTTTVTFDAAGESEPFRSPRYEFPVFFRRQAPQDGDGYVLAYSSDGSPTAGNRYETFATLAEVEAFAARAQLVPARD